MKHSWTSSEGVGVSPFRLSRPAYPPSRGEPGDEQSSLAQSQERAVGDLATISTANVHPKRHSRTLSDPALNSLADPERSSSPPKKRSKPDPSPRMVYPRKRAAIACQLCRSRKSKCDNRRPTCGACSQAGAQCVYWDLRSDHSSFFFSSTVL